MATEAQRRARKRRRQRANARRKKTSPPNTQTVQHKPANQGNKRSVVSLGPSNSRVSGSFGSMTVEMTEILASDVDKGKAEFISIFPSATCMPFLHKLYGLYSRASFKYLHIAWRPAASITTSGMIAFGFNAGTDKPDISTRAAVLCLAGATETPVRTGARISLPAFLLQSRKWLTTTTEGTDMYDYAVGQLGYNTKGATVSGLGDFIVSYHVTLVGPKP